MPLPGVRATVPWGINNAGDVAGWYAIGIFAQGFVLSGGSWTAVDHPAATEGTEVHGINSAKHLVGAYGSHGFLATPVPAQVQSGTFWIGLKNSDDQGTQFDLRTEVFRDGTMILAGETRCVTGVTRNPALAKQVGIPVAQTTGADPGDAILLKVLTRIGTNLDGSKCSGPGGSHSNAVGLRLYYDATIRESQLSVVTGANPATSYFLRALGSSLFLDLVPPDSSTAKYRDSAAINFAQGNPWKEIGTWETTVR